MDDTRLGSSREEDRSAAHGSTIQSEMATLGEPPAEHREVTLKGTPRASSSQSILVLTPQERLYHRLFTG
jgi:hypothetical protein